VSVFKFAVSLKKFDEFIGNEFETFNFFLISLLLFIETTLGDALKLSEYSF
jgi:hypothetical protein